MGGRGRRRKKREKRLLVIQSRHNGSSVLSDGWDGKQLVCVCGLVSVFNGQKRDSKASCKLGALYLHPDF